MHRIALAVTVLVAIFFGVHASASLPLQAKVYRVDGDITARDIVNIGWQPVAPNNLLSQNTLVRVKKGTSVGLRLFRGAPIRSNLIGVVRLAQQGIYKVDEALIRKHKFDDYRLKDLPEAVEQEKEQHPKSPFLKFFVAWERMFATLRYHIPITEVSPKIPQFPDRADFEAAEILGTIEIKKPESGRYFLVDRFPAHIDLAWVPRKSIRRYRIFVRKNSETFAEGSKVTAGNRFRLRFDEEGEWEVKIVSHDYRYQSPTISIGVGLPSSLKSIIGPGQPKGIYLSEQTPAVDTVRYARLPISELFSWKFAAAVEGAVKFCFKLESESETHCKATSGQGYSIGNFKAPGTYYWYLEVVTSKGIWRSAVGRYQLITSSEASVLSLTKLLRMDDRESARTIILE